MAKRKGNPLKRKTGSREYRAICWVSAEGQTEKDYLQMDIFRTSDIIGSSGFVWVDASANRGATVYTNAPKRRRESVFANLCTLLRHRPH